MGIPSLSTALAALLVVTCTAVATAQTARTDIAARDLQSELAVADASYNARQWDRAIAGYEAILKEAPMLSVCYLRIAEAYDVTHDYERVLATYSRLLKIDPANANANVGMAMTNLKKGDMRAAEEWLLKAADASGSKEIYYNLGELKLAEGRIDEAATWYQKAVDADPNWIKSSLKLALVTWQRNNEHAPPAALKADPSR